MNLRYCSSTRHRLHTTWPILTSGSTRRKMIYLYWRNCGADLQNKTANVRIT